jgi:hypothetical protein
MIFGKDRPDKAYISSKRRVGVCWIAGDTASLNNTLVHDVLNRTLGGASKQLRPKQKGAVEGCGTAASQSHRTCESGKRERLSCEAGIVSTLILPAILYSPTIPICLLAVRSKELLDESIIWRAADSGGQMSASGSPPCH